MSDRLIPGEGLRLVLWLNGTTIVAPLFSVKSVIIQIVFIIHGIFGNLGGKSCAESTCNPPIGAPGFTHFVLPCPEDRAFSPKK